MQQNNDLNHQLKTMIAEIDAISTSIFDSILNNIPDNFEQLIQKRENLITELIALLPLENKSLLKSIYDYLMHLYEQNQKHIKELQQQQAGFKSYILTVSHLKDYTAAVVN